jgi:hypothetical protein
VGIGDGLGTSLAEAAREALTHAMSRGSIVVSAVAAIGALIAWRYLPDLADELLSEENDTTTEGTDVATRVIAA